MRGVSVFVLDEDIWDLGSGGPCSEVGPNKEGKHTWNPGV